MRLRLWAAATAFAVLNLMSPAGADAPAAPHGLTVDDVLKHESLGLIQLDPTARYGVIERVPPHDTLKDYAMFAQIERRTMSTITAFATASPEQMWKIEPAPDADGAWAGTFSPSGKRLVVYWIASRKLYAGIYDFETRRITTLPFTPRVADASGEHVWISDDRVVFAAAAPGQLIDSDFLRARVIARMAQQWQNMSEGKTASVTVFDGTAKMPVTSDVPPGTLVVADAAGQVKTLTQGDFIELRASPDRRFVAAIRVGDVQPPAPGAPLSATGWRNYGLSVFDFARDGTALSPCGSCKVEAATVEWSEDSSALIAFTRKESQTWSDGRFLRYDPVKRSGKVIEHKGLDLISERERYMLQRPERAVPVAGAVFVYARPLGDTTAAGKYDTLRQTASPSRADWYAVGSNGKATNLTSAFKQVNSVVLGTHGASIFVLADGKLWKLGADGSQTNITEKVAGPVMPAPFTLTAATNRMRLPWPKTVVLMVMGPQRSLVVVDLTTDAVKSVAMPAGVGELSALDPASGLLIYRDNGMFGDSPSRTTSLFVAKPGEGAQKLFEINQHYRQVAFGKQEQVTYTYEGMKLTGCSVLPVNFDPKKKYPVIVEVYPGVGSVSGMAPCYTDNVAIFNPYNPQLYAAQGYMYFIAPAPNKFIQTKDGPLDRMAEVVLAGVDALVAKGHADPDRVGLYGISQGGFAAPWVLTRTKRFKAAVATHGAVNYASEYGQIALLRSVLPGDYFSAGDAIRYEDTSSSFFLGGSPWTIPDAFVKNSPLFNAGKIETPLMMINSDFDTFPMNQYQEMFTALYRQNKPVQLVTYWGESHGVYSPANVRDQWTRLFDWYGRYLKKK